MTRELLPFIPRRLDRFIDRTGQRNDRLLAIRPMQEAGDRQVFWECRCDCGAVSMVRSHLFQKTHSCGCLCAERVSKAKTTHGMSHSRTYRVWHLMKQRCNLSTSENYPDYGGRGITYAPAWERFEAFLADMGEVPPGMEIDRIDNDGNYEPGNVRWATRVENENNKRTSAFVEFRGERMTVAQLARRCGLADATLRHRLSRGWRVEDAAARPPRGYRGSTNRVSP